MKLLNTLQKDGFYLTQGYGVNSGTYAQYGLLWHEGIDLGHTNKTKEIRALHDGIVVQDWDEPKGNYGEYVVIWDDEQNLATWYCHLSENSVEYGQRVKAGDVIGKMGSSGNVTGPHLHLNFVLTDEQGNRLYNNKSQNWGFLDAQSPLDPHVPKYPPNVQPYITEWTQGGSMSEIDDLKKQVADLQKEVADKNIQIGNYAQQVSGLQQFAKDEYQRGFKDGQASAPSSGVDLSKWEANGLTTEQTVGGMKTIVNYKRKV